MMNWMNFNIWDLIVGALVAFVLVIALRTALKKHRSGGFCSCGSGGGCAGCSGCSGAEARGGNCPAKMSSKALGDNDR